MTDELNTNEVYGIVLLPEDSATAAMVDFSRELNDVCASKIVLGKETILPHITLVHVSTSLESARALWDSVKDALEPGLQLPCIWGYSPSSSKGYGGFLAVNLTDALHRCHQICVESAQASQLEITSAHSERYFPHVTTSKWDEVPNVQIPLTHELLTTSFRADPALVLMGEHGTALEVIAR